MRYFSGAKPRIAITVGDFNGVGPEIALKSIISPRVRQICYPVLVGPGSVFAYYANRMDLRPGGTCITVADTLQINKDKIRPGRVSGLAGRVAANAIEAAVEMTRYGVADAIVTAPVSKQAMHLAGIGFPGQTEMLQKLSGSRRVAMMLVSPTMKVGLVTIHLPVRDISRTMTQKLVAERILIINAALMTDWGIKKPRLAVLGLNPHAGENGDLGTEEQQVITPVLRRLNNRGIRLDGPFPADGFFGTYDPKKFDAVVAMYHDQGLIPLKMSGFHKGVNVSVGLDIIRTSPDHGTAFDIAGQGIANPSSMIEAIRLAATIVRNRKRSSSKRTR